MECARRDKEDVVGANHAVLGVDRCPLDDRKDVALDPFAADVGTVRTFAPRNLVDLVDEDDARLLDLLDGGSRDAVHVDQLPLLLLRQVFEGLGHFHAPLFRLALE